ncbi:MAG: RNA polymerase sigma factor [Spirochaetes bacterium]|nr:RNA polymerase sigma factor [Spirochaetota bacterium]
MTDQELMILIKKGDTEAFNLLYEKYQQSVYRFIYTLIGNSMETEDIFQEVFLSLYRNRKTYIHLAKFSTYLFTITRSRCIDYLRKMKPETLSDEEYPVDQIRDERNIQDQLDKQEIYRDYYQLLENMPEIKKTALFLKDMEGYDYQSIAEILNKPLGTVKTIIHRARERVYSALRSQYE